MKNKSFATAAGAAAMTLTLWLSPAPLRSQPLYDRIHVNIPYKLTLGDKVLQPGEYTIQQLPDNGGGSRVLLFYTDNGMKFETSALTIPALDINTARDTKLVLEHTGEDYYISKIWVQGKDYGYELPVPPALRERQHEKTETVAAQTMTPAPAPTTQSTTTEKAETTPPPPPVTSQTETRSTEPTPPPVQSQPVEQNPPTTSAEQTRPAEPQTAATPDNTADRSAESTPAPTEMPHTAANWLMMLLSGSTLSGAGLFLLRKR
jgi:hypothetical protein